MSCAMSSSLYGGLHLYRSPAAEEEPSGTVALQYPTPTLLSVNLGIYHVLTYLIHPVTYLIHPLCGRLLIFSY